MRMLLICPSERSSIPLLQQYRPLTHVPMLGQNLLEYWLSDLSSHGVTQVLVLAHDRPELAKETVRIGERWGLDAQVISESRELTIAEATLKYANEPDLVPAQQGILLLDHFPTLADQPLFIDYKNWFSALRAFIPYALTPDRVGINEVQPEVWMGCHSQVSKEALLRPPCWIGQHTFVGAGAVVGPGAVVEDVCFIEPGAELVESWVGPDTFVGEFARIKGSLAWGNNLVNWQTGSEAQVADPYLLSALRNRSTLSSPGWLRKLSDLYARNKRDAGVLWKHLLLHKEG